MKVVRTKKKRSFKDKEKEQEQDQEQENNDPPTKKRKENVKLAIVEIEDVFGLCQHCRTQLLSRVHVKIDDCDVNSCATFWKKNKFRHHPDETEQKWNFTHTERYQCLHQILIEFLITPLIHNIGQLIQWSSFQDIVLPFDRMEMSNVNEMLCRNRDPCEIISLAVTKDDDLLILCLDYERDGHLFSKRLTDPDRAGWDSIHLKKHDNLSGITVDHQSGIVYINKYDFNAASVNLVILHYAKQDYTSDYSLINTNVWPPIDRIIPNHQYNVVNDEFLVPGIHGILMNGESIKKKVGIEESPIPSNCKLHFRADGCVAILHGTKLAFEKDDSCACIIRTYRFLIVDPNNNNKIMERKEFIIHGRNTMDSAKLFSKFFSKPITDFAFDDRRIVFIENHMIFVVSRNLENAIYSMNLKWSICEQVVISGDTIILSAFKKDLGPFCLVYNLSI
jgi:hypothetical protein